MGERGRPGKHAVVPDLSLEKWLEREEKKNTHDKVIQK